MYNQFHIRSNVSQLKKLYQICWWTGSILLSIWLRHTVKVSVDCTQTELVVFFCLIFPSAVSDSSYCSSFGEYKHVWSDDSYKHCHLSAWYHMLYQVPTAEKPSITHVCSPGSHVYRTSLDQDFLPDHPGCVIAFTHRWFIHLTFHEQKKDKVTRVQKKMPVKVFFWTDKKLSWNLAEVVSNFQFNSTLFRHVYRY